MLYDNDGETQRIIKLKTRFWEKFVDIKLRINGTTIVFCVTIFGHLVIGSLSPK